MIVFTKKILRLKSAFLFLSLIITLGVQAQYATDIYTDYNGFWHSNVSSFSPILPNKSHNLIGFTYGGVTYSTDVNNSILTNNSVAFTPGHYKTLPFTSLAGTVPTNNNAIYIAVGEQYDNVPNGFSNPLPGLKAKQALTDGVNGLNIGTGVTNLPSSAGMTFPAQIVSTSAITDNQPDLIYAQMTDAASSADVLLFQDDQGHTVGKSNSIQWNLAKAVANYSADFYNLRPGAALDTASITGGVTMNSTQSLRLITMNLSDFGITAANASQVKSLVIKPAGSSDPAFIAYNSDALYIIPPIINVQPLSQIVCTGTGQSATFSVDATGINLTYQWLKNGSVIPGATNSTFTISTVAASDIGNYQVVVTNPGGTQYSNVAYLNMVINRQPFPASQTIVTGNTITYSVSATNATTYQWKRNGVDIPGATDSVYTINPVTTKDSGIYTVNVINPAGNGCASLTSNAVSLTPAIVVYSKSSPDINIPSTWGANTDGSGSTPVDFTRSEHTFVLSNRPSGNTLTNLTIAGTLDVKDGIAIIADNTTLDVGWCIRTGSGSITGSTSAGLTVRGNSNLYFTPANQVLKNFTVAGGTVNMLSDLTISGGTLPGKLNLTAGTLAVGSNKITIRSTSISNTSMVTALGATAAVTYATGGAFIVERFIPAKRAFRLLSPAVTTTSSIKDNWMEGVSNPDRWLNYDPVPGYGTHITGPKQSTDSLDVTQTYNPSLFSFDNSSQLWSVVPNSSGTLKAGNPFRLMVRGSRAVDLNDNYAIPSNTVLRATGTLATGDQSMTPLLSKTAGGFSFIGNPYACPVNWNKIAKTGLANSYYTYDETQGTRGAYVSYNSTSLTNSSATSAVDENIQSGQAIFVQSNTGTPSLTFTEASKSSTNTSVFRTAGTLTKFSAVLLLNLNPGSSNTADGFVAVFSDKFSKSVGFEDSYKFTNLDENMAINRNGIALSIEARPYISGADTLPIKIWQYRQKSYYIRFSGENFDPLVKATLKDAYLNKETALDLSSSTTVSFNITADSASFASNRFTVIFGTGSTLPVILTQVKANRQDKGIQVEWQTITETNINTYEVERSTNMRDFDKVFTTVVKAENSLGNTYNWLDNTAADGTNFYRIKITDKAGNITYSPVVSVNMVNSKSTFTIYPNPITGNTISVQMTNMQEGKYNVDIINLTGQSVNKTVLQHSGASGTQIISLRQKLPAGKYLLQLTKDQQSITKTILVQ